MAPVAPPIAVAQRREDRFSSNAELFETFAMHYTTIMHNNKKKIRNYLKVNEVRRSPRLAAKQSKTKENNRKKKTKRICRILSFSNEDNLPNLVPVMKFPALKQKRKMELKNSKTKKKLAVTNGRHADDDDHLEPKSEVTSASETLISVTNISNETENNQNEFEVEVHIEEDTRSTESNMEAEYSQEMDAPTPCTPLDPQLQYMNPQPTFINPQSTFMGPESIPLGPQYTFMESNINQNYGHSFQFQPHFGLANQMFTQQRYISTFQGFTVSPDSSAYHECAPPPQPPQSIYSPPPTNEPHFPHNLTQTMDSNNNCRLSVNWLMDPFECNGKFVSEGNFTCEFGMGYQAHLTGNLTFNTIEEKNAFQSNFLSNYDYIPGISTHSNNQYGPYEQQPYILEHTIEKPEYTVELPESPRPEEFSNPKSVDKGFSNRFETESTLEEVTTGRHCIRKHFDIDDDVIECVEIDSSSEDEEMAETNVFPNFSQQRLHFINYSHLQQPSINIILRNFGLYLTNILMQRMLETLVPVMRHRGQTRRNMRMRTDLLSGPALNIDSVLNTERRIVRIGERAVAVYHPPHHPWNHPYDRIDYEIVILFGNSGDGYIKFVPIPVLFNTNRTYESIRIEEIP